MSGAAAELGEPPAQTDEQKAPIVEELGGFTLYGVADELQTPTAHEHGRRDGPDAMHEWDREEQRQR